MSPDDPYHAATLRVVITDAMGRPLRKPALARWLQSIAPASAHGTVTLALVSDAAIRRLNRQYAGKDRATDVLSFPNKQRVAERRPAPGLKPGSRTPVTAPHLAYLGDVAIATGVAARQAHAAGHPLETELRVLALHGLLHLLGYDHSTDSGRMARVERRLRAEGGLREGLIDRASLPRRSARRTASGDRRRAKAGGQGFRLAGGSGRRGRRS